MTILAIDTSTAFASVCLFARGVVSEATWRTGKNHTVQVAARIDELLRETGLAPADLTGIAVAIGPGSFSGVRVGVSLAKAIAHALGAPLVGIPTLEVAAREFAWFPGSIRPLIDGGRGQVATALYTGGSGEVSLAEDAHLSDLSNLLPVHVPTLFCGEVTPDWEVALRDFGGLMAHVAPLAGRSRRSGFLAEAALRRLERGQVDDPLSLQPVYLRRPAVLDRIAMPSSDQSAIRGIRCPT